MITSSSPKDPKLVSVYVRVGFLLLWTLKTPVSPLSLKTIVGSRYSTFSGCVPPPPQVDQLALCT
jgi:hypothetical protein